MKKIKEWFRIIRRSLLHFGESNPMQLAATTAYFAIFSMAPILIIIISLVGFLTGDETIRGKLFDEIARLVGEKSSALLENAIANYNLKEKSIWGTVIGLGVFLFSATTLFSVMQNSINFIWRVKVKSKLKIGIIKFLLNRLFSFGMILSLGLVALISLIVDASVAFLKDIIISNFSSDFLFLSRLINLGASLAIIALMFMLIFKFLPDVKIKWSAAVFSALLTSVLFTMGKFIIGLIIGNSSLGVVYGAASSFVIIILWIYFVALIFYFGVEVSKQYSKFYEHNNSPVNFSVPFEISPVEKESGA